MNTEPGGFPPTEPSSPSDLTADLSLFGCWVILWLIITVAIVTGWILWAHDTTTVIDDWPDGSSAEADHWHGGVFLGHPADRIRYVAAQHGEYVDVNTIRFFAAIPMTQAEMDCELRLWRTSSGFHLKSGEVIPRQGFPDAPGWFPAPSTKSYIGTLIEDGWTCDFFRRPGDDHLYIALK